MKQIHSNIRFLVLVSVLFLMSCNQQESASSNTGKDTSQVAATEVTSPMPEYDPAMDSYHVGGKGIKRLGDTLGVKMYELTVEPGESWAPHTHPDHTFYVIQGGKVALYIKATGKQDTLTFPTGMALVSGPLTDSGRNVGNTTLKGLVTDIYRPRSK